MVLTTPTVLVDFIEENQALIRANIPTNQIAQSWNVRTVNLDLSTQTNLTVTSGSDFGMSVFISRLIAGTNYRVLVSARDASGFSNEGIVEFQTLGAAPPPPPPPPPTGDTYSTSLQNFTLINGKLTGQILIDRLDLNAPAGINYWFFVNDVNFPFGLNFTASNSITKNIDIPNIVTPAELRGFVISGGAAQSNIITDSIIGTLENVFTFDIIVTKSDGTTQTILNNALTETNLNALLALGLPIEIINQQITTTFTGQNIQTVIDEINAVLAQPPTPPKVSTDMITQSNGVWNIEDNRITGEILFIASTKFNSFFFDKAILSIVSIKDEFGTDIITKQNDLFFTSTERDERIIFDEFIPSEIQKVKIKSVVFVSQTDTAAFSLPLEFEVIRSDPPTIPPPTNGKVDFFRLLPLSLIGVLFLNSARKG